MYLFIRVSNVTRNPELWFAKCPSPMQWTLQLKYSPQGICSFLFLFHLSPHSALIPMLQAHWHSGSMRTCLAPTPLSTLVAVSSLCFKFSSPLLLCSWSLLTFSYQFRWHLLESSFLDITSQIDHPIAPWKKSYDQPRQYIKKQRHYFANKGPSSQSYGFSSSHKWMGELDHKES